MGLVGSVSDGFDGSLRFLSVTGSIKKEKVMVGFAIFTKEDIGHAASIQDGMIGIGQGNSRQTRERWKNVHGTNRFRRPTKGLNLTLPVRKGRLAYSTYILAQKQNKTVDKSKQQAETIAAVMNVQQK